MGPSSCLASPAEPPGTGRRPPAHWSRTGVHLQQSPSTVLLSRFSFQIKKLQEGERAGPGLQAFSYLFKDFYLFIFTFIDFVSVISSRHDPRVRRHAGRIAATKRATTGWDEAGVAGAREALGCPPPRGRTATSRSSRLDRSGCGWGEERGRRGVETETRERQRRGETDGGERSKGERVRRAKTRNYREIANKTGESSPRDHVRHFA